MKFRNINVLYETSEHVESSFSRAKNIDENLILKMCKYEDFEPSNLKKEISFAKKAEKHNFGPKIFSYGFHNQIGYIEMERMKVSLKELIYSNNLKLFHVKSLKKALKQMWKRGKFIHMDLHTENIWFDKKGCAKLIDFGQVYKIDDSTSVEESREKLTYSAYDIHSLVDFLLPDSRCKKELIKLKEVMSGNWM